MVDEYYYYYYFGFFGFKIFEIFVSFCLVLGSIVPPQHTISLVDDMIVEDTGVEKNKSN